MATTVKVDGLEIPHPQGHSSTGFNSTQISRSGVSVDCHGCGGARICVYRDDEDIIKPTELTTEEAWVLYTTLRDMFHKGREAERLLYKNKYNLD